MILLQLVQSWLTLKQSKPLLTIQIGRDYLEEDYLPQAQLLLIVWEVGRYYRASRLFMKLQGYLLFPESCKLSPCLKLQYFGHLMRRVDSLEKL